MESTKNQRDVEDRLRDAVKMDRARIQIGRLSRFGLLEMSRQRLRPSLGESSHIVCPRCVGIGSIRSIESMALSILRLIGEELRKDRTVRVIAQVPVDVATYLFNEKREWMRALEDKSEVELIIVPNLHMQTPEYSIRRIRDDEVELPENKQLSYLMPVAAAVADPALAEKKPVAEAAAVATLLPTTSAPIVAAPPAPAPIPAPAPVAVAAAPQRGLFKRLMGALFGDAPAASAPAAPAESPGSARPEARGGERTGSDRDVRRHGRDRDRGRGGRDGRDEIDIAAVVSVTAAQMAKTGVPTATRTAALSGARIAVAIARPATTAIATTRIARAGVISRRAIRGHGIKGTGIRETGIKAIAIKATATNLVAVAGSGIGIGIGLASGYPIANRPVRPR